MTNYTHKSKFFCGNEISEYGLQHGYIDYRTLANSFDAVMNNDIIKNTCDIGYWDIVNGCEYWEDEDGNENYYDVFQLFIISEAGADILKDYTNEIIYYNETLDMYVWGITHWGTSWDYVLTDIKIELSNED